MKIIPTVRRIFFFFNLATSKSKMRPPANANSSQPLGCTSRVKTTPPESKMTARHLNEVAEKVFDFGVNGPRERACAVPSLHDVFGKSERSWRTTLRDASGRSQSGAETQKHVRLCDAMQGIKCFLVISGKCVND